MEESSKLPSIVELNVGGRYFTTTLLTLTKCQNNMLAAMFSGNYSVMRDNNGRFFIDADGDHFAHILNYLRYGHIPPASIADSVYQEALYFGVNGLVEELEKYPSILGKIQRNSFRNRFPGYRECIDTILSAASSPTSKTTSNIKVMLFQKESPEAHMHQCSVCSKYDNQTFFTADATLGPWSHDCSEKDVLNCLVFDLESQGFTVTSQFYGTCGYKVEEEGFNCEKSFYNFSFHWWKS